MLVNLFIVGAPKTGTTSFANYLSQHPDICISSPKESYFFSSDLKERGQYNGSINGYEKMFFRGCTGKETFYCDASTHNLYSEIAIENILRYNPDARFIVFLRNPVDLFISWHSQMLASGHEDIISPIDAWHAQHERKQGARIPKWCTEPKLLYYSEICSLGAQVSRLTNLVEHTNVKFVFFEDLKSNPKKELDEVLSFLNLPTIADVNLTASNQRKQWRSPFIAEVFMLLRNFKRKLGLDGVVRVGDKLQGFFYKKQETPKLPDDFIQKLKIHFKSDIDHLSLLVSRDLGSWHE